MRTLAQGAEQAEAWAGKARAIAAPVLQTIYGLRRRLATALVGVVAIWLFLHVMFGANGTVVYRTKRSGYQALQKEISGLQKENAQYTDQINQLKTDPKRIEKEAREQFHYARPGEVVYVSPEAPAPPAPTSHSASR